MKDEPKRVFCKDCRHLIRNVTHGTFYSWEVLGDNCTTEPELTVDPIKGEVRKLVACRVRNADLDCKLFERMPPVSKTSSWWERFTRWAGGAR